MGVLELLERGAPEHTVNEHVALVKSVMHVGAGNVANFVLRCALQGVGGCVGGPPRVWVAASLVGDAFGCQTRGKRSPDVHTRGWVTACLSAAQTRLWLRW